MSGEPVEKVVPTGGMTTFNMQHGFTEAMVRGYRSGFLKDSDYHHLTQCETLDDVKMNLAETDYDQFLADAVAVTPAVIQVCTQWGQPLPLFFLPVFVPQRRPPRQCIHTARDCLCMPTDGCNAQGSDRVSDLARALRGAPDDIPRLYHLRVHDR